MSKLTRTQLHERKRERAKAELALRLIQFMDNFKSKEEPSVKLTYRDETEILANIVARRISRLPNLKK